MPSFLWLYDGKVDFSFKERWRLIPFIEFRSSHQITPIIGKKGCQKSLNIGKNINIDYGYYNSASPDHTG
jgi:hypothetical protein